MLFCASRFVSPGSGEALILIAYFVFLSNVSVNNNRNWSVCVKTN